MKDKLEIGTAIATLKLRGLDMIEYATRVDAERIERPEWAGSCFWLERLEQTVAEAQAALNDLKTHLAAPRRMRSEAAERKAVADLRDAP